MRKTAEWKEIHNELLKQPFCHKKQRLVRIIMCLDYDNNCRWEGLCYPCLKQGINHELFYTPPIENIPLVKFALILTTGTAHITILWKFLATVCLFHEEYQPPI